jgi:hypothetical protein
VSERLQLDRPRHEILGSTNSLLEFRESLTKEARERLDEDHFQLTAQLLHNARAQQSCSIAIPRFLPPPIPQTWNRKAKSHDKVMKRMMTRVANPGDYNCNSYVTMQLQQ